MDAPADRKKDRGTFHKFLRPGLLQGRNALADNLAEVAPDTKRSGRIPRGDFSRGMGFKREKNKIQ